MSEAGAMSQCTFTIKPVLEKDIQGAMGLLQKTFYIDEPLNQAVGLCANGACAELDEYCRYSIMEGLSFKAEDDEGNIVGVSISGVCPLKEPDNGNDITSQAERCQNRKFQKILYILAKREKYAKLWEKFPADRFLVEIKVAATNPAWRRRGIMAKLVKETEKATIQRGLRLLRMDTSSAFSAKSAERLHFKCYYRALYKDITMNGTPLIVPEPPHVEDRVYVKELFQLNN